MMSRQEGQILVLSALVLVVVFFLMGLVVAVAQIHGAHAQLEKAAVLAGRSGALLLGDRLMTSPGVPDLGAIQEEVRAHVQTAAGANAPGDVEVVFNNAAEIEVTTAREVPLFFGMPPSHRVTATATVQVIPREDAGG